MATSKNNTHERLSRNGSGAGADRSNAEQGPNRTGYRAHPSNGGAPFFVGESDSPDNAQVKGSGQGLAVLDRWLNGKPDRLDSPAVAVWDGGLRPLEKNTSKVTTPPSPATPTKPKGDARKVRYALRDGLQRITEHPRVLKCGRCRVRESVDVVRCIGSGAHYAGVMSCGSVWLCPVCAAKVDARRATEVCGVLTAHLGAGGAAYFLTFTLPHHTGDRLERTRRLTAKAFQRLLQSGGWQRLKARLGIVGTIRALEVTHGGNGWHPHLHTLVLSDSPLTPEQVAALDAYAFGAWRDAVTAQGHPAPLRTGFAFQPVADAQLGEYVTKMGAALEITHGAQKKGRKSGQRTPFQILSDFVQWGDDADLTLWLEYEAAMKGARRLTWSRGLKARYAVDEVSDEELATEEVGGEIVANLSADEWRGVLASNARLAVLEAAERDGAAGVAQVLAALPLPPPRLCATPDDGGGG